MQETSQETGNYDENAQLVGGQGGLIAGSHGWQVGSEYYELKKKRTSHSKWQQSYKGKQGKEKQKRELFGVIQNNT